MNVEAVVTNAQVVVTNAQAVVTNIQANEASGCACAQSVLR